MMNGEKSTGILGETNFQEFPFGTECTEKRSGRVVYELEKPRPNASGAITLDPLELIDRLVVLIPPPRIHEVFPSCVPTATARCG